LVIDACYSTRMIKEVGNIGDYRPPSWDRLFMRLVYEYASKSKDPSSKIGAVVVRDRRPILFGYNGFPERVEDLPDRMINREMKLFLT
jgi:dCMP deaminase